MSVSHSTESSDNGNTPEHHELQCRALNIPIQIVQLINKGKVSVKKAYLLAYVDALFQANGTPCFASNQWLAPRLQVKIRQLQSMISDLFNMKLLIIEHKDGKRYLETPWTRAGVTTKRRVQKTAPSAENCVLGVQKPALGDAETCIHINTVDKKDSNDINRRLKAGDGGMNDSDEFSETLIPVNAIKDKNSITMEFSVRLYKALQRNGKSVVIPDLNKWDKEFSALIKQPGVNASRIEKALEWFSVSENIRWQYTPKIRCARTFREKFIDLEDAIENKAYQSKSRQKSNGDDLVW